MDSLLYIHKTLHLQCQPSHLIAWCAGGKEKPSLGYKSIQRQAHDSQRSLASPVTCKCAHLNEVLIPGLTDPQEGVPARHSGDWDNHVSRLLPANLIHAVLQLDLPWQIHSLVQMVCAPIACTRKGMWSALGACPACPNQKALWWQFEGPVQSEKQMPPNLNSA